MSPLQAPENDLKKKNWVREGDKPEDGEKCGQGPKRPFQEGLEEGQG